MAKPTQVQLSLMPVIIKQVIILAREHDWRKNNKGCHMLYKYYNVGTPFT